MNLKLSYWIASPGAAFAQRVEQRAVAEHERDGGETAGGSGAGGEVRAPRPR